MADIPESESLKIIETAVLVPEMYATRKGQPLGHGPKFTARAVLAALAEQGWEITRRLGEDAGPADDRLSAALEEIRARSRECAYYCDWTVPRQHLAASTADVPRLLAALDAVLAAHRNADGRCAWCRNPDGLRQKWPCGEYQAITRALLGEGGDDSQVD